MSDYHPGGAPSTPLGFTFHFPFWLILLLHLALALTYAASVPLGEAPDEPAHLSYAHFIARNGRPPTTLEERHQAGYRSAWPPLYHFFIAGPLTYIGNTPPARLKAVGDTPRRLIPTNGQTIASFIHTADEATPWRGLPLAWHLSRYLSVALTTLAVTTTYAIAWQLTRRRSLSTAAAAVHAFIPQVLFIGSVLNDDNLLIFLSGLVLLTLIHYTRRPRRGYAFLLGVLLGLATITKYNALPLWAFVILWLIINHPLIDSHRQSIPHSPSAIRHSSRVHKGGCALPDRVFAIRYPLSAIGYLLLGATLTAGWWLIFTWQHFNRVEALGWLSGSLAALFAGASDASLRQLAGGGSVSLPSLSAWGEWFITLFETFWGSFGGGSTIDLPAWVYGVLALFCLLASIRIFTIYDPRSKGDLRFAGDKFKWQRPRFLLLNLQSPISNLFLLLPLFFLPLPMLRFILTGSLVETAQGRHLFPALSAVSLGLVWGLLRYRLKIKGSTFDFQLSTILLPLFILFLSLYSLTLIQAAYPPPIPLRTTPDAAATANPLNIGLTHEINLIGYELAPAENGLLPLTLVWQAAAVPEQDYLIELTVLDTDNQTIGGWLGHPLDGRYPTRAWDEGDILRDTIPIPLLPGQPTTPITLTLRLLDSFNQPTAPMILISNSAPLRSGDYNFKSPISNLQSPISNLPTLNPQPPISPTPLLPRSPAAPFTYRSTINLISPDPSPPQLTAPTGQTFTPTRVITGPTGSLAHFIVAANWPSGDYQLTTNNEKLSIPITNRPRQFTPPAVQYPLKANFADVLTLLGYDLPQRRIQPGQSFPVTLHWRAERTMGQPLVVFNHLLDSAHTQRGGADRVPQLYYTTLLWAPGEIVSDAYNVPVAADAPAGIYWLDVGLYPANRPTFSLPLFANGRPLERNSVRLGPLKVGGPPPEVVITHPQPQVSLNQTFGNQITLLGYGINRSNIKNCQLTIDNCQLSIILYWQADMIPTADYTVFVHLLDPRGNLIAQFDGPPAHGLYPTSLWDTGEIIVDERPLSGLSPGRYTLLVGLYHPVTGERLPAAGSSDGTVKLTEVEVE